MWDGDGPVWCAEGPRLRISGIAAREIAKPCEADPRGSCRPHHPCPEASGVAARDALVRLLGGIRGLVHLAPRGEPGDHVRVAGPRLACTSDGDAKGGRTAAICTLPATATEPAPDLACALLATGTVKRWPVFWPGRRCSAS